MDLAKLKEKWAKVKEQAEKFLAAPIAEKFLDAKLQDGTAIQIEGETLAEGVKVFVVGADGTLTPAPDAEHTLEDGTVVSTMGGVIIAVKPAAAAPAAVTEPGVEMSADVKAAIDKLTNDFSELSAKFVALEASNKAHEAKMATQEATITEAKALMSELTSLVNEIANAATAGATEQTPNQFQSTAKSVKERLEEFKSDLNDLRLGKANANK